MYSAWVSVIGGVGERGEVRRRGREGTERGQQVVGADAEDPHPHGGGEEDEAVADLRDEDDRGHHRERHQVGEGAVDEGEHERRGALPEDVVQERRGAVSVEEPQLEVHELPVDQGAEGVPALEVAVADVDHVVGDQPGDGQEEPLPGPPRAQVRDHGPGREALPTRPDDGLGQDEQGERDQRGGQPGAEHLALGVAQRHPDVPRPERGHRGEQHDHDQDRRQPPASAVVRTRSRRGGAGVLLGACWHHHGALLSGLRRGGASLSQTRRGLENRCAPLSAAAAWRRPRRGRTGRAGSTWPRGSGPHPRRGPTGRAPGRG